MKVLIVDNSLFLRERLASMISELPETEIIGQAENSQQGINSIRILMPDVRIMPESMKSICTLN